MLDLELGFVLVMVLDELWVLVLVLQLGFVLVMM
jgi:hypothetical protein